MKPAAKRIAILVALVAVGVVALAAWWFLPGRRAEVRLSPVSAEAVPRSALATEPIYLQTDPKWADEKIGGSGEPLRWVGCTVCCLSMALAHHGVMEDPAELNRKLKEADGYTYRGWVKWDVLRRITAERLRVMLPQDPTHRDIDAALAEGSPVLVKVVLRSGVQHWVLLVGRDQREYLMKDPLGDGRSLQALSSLGSDILAVRVIRRMSK
jgi:hypothetical protein